MAKQQQLKATESDIQRTIKDYLQWNGWFVVKIHQSLGSYKGIADLYALKDGRHVWIEVKTDRGRQSEHQRQFEQDIRDHGGRYIVARGIEDIEKHLKGRCEIENKAEIKTCANCERRHKNSKFQTTHCNVFLSKPEKCWAWTDDREWEIKVKQAVERYKLIS